MRDIFCTIKEGLTLSAAKTTYTDLDANMNFDFGDGGNLGYFPDVFIKVHCSVAHTVGALSFAIEDSADGSTYAVNAEFPIGAAAAAGQDFRIKLPVDHKRYVKVFYKYTLESGESADSSKFDVYLERG